MTGACKFDKTTWTVYNTETTNYGMLHDFVDFIIIDSERNKWFDTDNGLTQMTDKKPSNNANNPSNILLFPNPAHYQLTIQIDDSSIGSVCTIIDASGRILSKRKLKAPITTVNLASYPAGVYFAQITYQKEKSVKKFAKF